MTESVAILRDILQDSKAAKAEKLEASILLADCHKRLEDYTGVFEILDEAISYAGNIKDKNLIWSRLSMAHFDKKSYENSQRYLDSIIAHDYEGIELDQISFLKIQQAFSLEQNGDIKTYIEVLNHILAEMKQRSSCHQPVIYIKLCNAYQILKQKSKALEAYETGLENANHCNIDKYKFLLARQYYESLVRHGYAEDATEYYYVMEKYRSKAFKNVAIDLFKEESKNLEDKSKLHSKTNKRYTFMLISLLALIGGLVYWLARKSKIQKALAAENKKMKEELEVYLNNMDDQSESDLDDVITSGKFTERQVELLRLLKQNKSNKEIADELFISVNTVRYHIKNIYKIMEECDITFKR